MNDRLRCDECGHTWSAATSVPGMLCGLRVSSSSWCRGKLARPESAFDLAHRRVCELAGATTTSPCGRSVRAVMLDLVGKYIEESEGGDDESEVDYG